MINTKTFLSILIFILITSCSSQEKIDNIENYKTVYTETSSIEIDDSIKNHEITTPSVKPNSVWPNSNLVLSRIPENISIHSPLDDYKKCQVFKDSGSTSNILRTPVVYKGNMYLLNHSSALYAYNLQDFSKPKWIKKLADPSNFLLGGGIAVNKNTIVVTDGSNTITAIALDGTEIWKQSLSNISRSTPTIQEDKIYITTIDNRLYCLSLTTGSVIWFYQSALDNLHTLQSPSPVTYKNIVIYPFSINEISAIDSDTGQLVWNADLTNYKVSSTNINDVDLTPLISNTSIYVSSFEGDISSINLNNGAVEWTINKAGSNIGMWSADNYVYTITKEGYLTAIYKITGSVKWAKNLKNMIPDKERQNISFTGPVMINSVLYVFSSNGHMMKISPFNGNSIKILPFSNNIFAFPIVVEKNIYLLSRDGSLVLVR